MNSHDAFQYFQTLDDRSSDEEIDDNESDFEPAMITTADEDESNDEIPDSNSDPSTSRPRFSNPSQPRSTRPRDQDEKIQWSDQLQNIDIRTFAADSTSNVDLFFDNRPFDFFEKYIPDLFYKKLAFETNRYAEQKMVELNRQVDSKWKKITVEEIKIFIYINFMFGIHSLPNIRQYCSTDPLLSVSSVSDAMSRNRYFKINRYLHLNNSLSFIPRGTVGHDPMYKVRPLLDLVLHNSRMNFTPGAFISVDEAMIAFKGRLFQAIHQGEAGTMGHQSLVRRRSRNWIPYQLSILHWQIK